MNDVLRRGRLKVYLGAAPGVGKTYRMLDEVRRRAARGADVVVGFAGNQRGAVVAHAVRRDTDAVICRLRFRLF
jgi:K+-sensing histidine kinase KdpD